MHRARHLSAPSATLPAPARTRARTWPVLRRASALLVMAGLGTSLPSQAGNGAPPVKPSTGGVAAAPVVPASGAVRAPEAAASAVRVDPLELLRRRLIERLAGGAPVSGAGSPHEVRLLTHPSADKAAAPAKPATRLSRRAVQPKVEPVVQAEPARWSYQGPAGPQAWADLKPEFALCAKGQRQSPIDIRGGLAVDLEPVKFNYQDSPFGVIDNGYTVQANVASGNTIELMGRHFELTQLHFHRPSEERIDGRQFEMSMHLVHQDAQGALAVVAVLFDKGSAQPVVQQVLNHLPLEKGQERAARVPLDLNELLPTDRRYYTYMGSLTAPPCSEGVQWVVMRQPVTVSSEQIELFARIYPMNARPLQQAADRRILQSQ